MIKNYIFGSTYETICVLSAQLPLVNYILLLIAVDCVSGRVLRKENMVTDNILNFFKMWFLNILDLVTLFSFLLSCTAFLMSYRKWCEASLCLCV